MAKLVAWTHVWTAAAAPPPMSSSSAGLGEARAVRTAESVLALEPLPPAEDGAYAAADEVALAVPIAEQLGALVSAGAPFHRDIETLCLALATLLARTRCATPVAVRTEAMVAIAASLSVFTDWAMHNNLFMNGAGMPPRTALAAISVWITIYNIRQQRFSATEPLKDPDIHMGLQQMQPDSSLLTGWSRDSPAASPRTSSSAPSAAAVKRFHEWLQACADVVTDKGAHWALRLAACHAIYSYANGTEEAAEASKFHRDGVASLALVDFAAESVPGLSRDAQDGSACTERADTFMFFNEVGTAWFQIVSAVQRLGVAERDPKIFDTYAMKCVQSGVASVCIRCLRALCALGGGKELGANHSTAFCVVVLQMLASGAGCAREILARLSYQGNRNELRDLLSTAITLGPDTVRSFGWFKTEVYAAMAMAVIYGREEGDADGDDGQDVTVPTTVIDSLLLMYREMLDGNNPGSPVNMANCLLPLSISDANTAVLVHSLARTGLAVDTTDSASGYSREKDDGSRSCKILDSITVALAQGKDVVSSRKTWFRYDVAMARESISEVLLNLSLSEKTVEAVEGHAELQSAIKNALTDEESLTPKTKKRLNNVLFRLEQRTEAGKKATLERVEAAAASSPSRHVMLSYCWAQQEVVLRIRKELGARNYRIWIGAHSLLIRLFALLPS